MTLRPTLFGDALKNLDQYFVGFDSQFNRLDKLYSDITKNIPTYPPYNIKKLEDERYLIEIAVAGFDKSEIDIEVEDSKLTVRGSSKEENQTYLHKGIAKRDFTRTFVLNDNVIVKRAGMNNGMLVIELIRVIPEESKTRKIAIENGITTTESTKQLLCD